MRNSAFNRLLLQQCFTTKLGINTRELAYYGITNIDTTGKDLSFH